jgi:hypothetical protein
MAIAGIVIASMVIAGSVIAGEQHSINLARATVTNIQSKHPIKSR